MVNDICSKCIKESVCKITNEYSNEEVCVSCAEFVSIPIKDYINVPTNDSKSILTKWLLQGQVPDYSKQHGHIEGWFRESDDKAFNDAILALEKIDALEAIIDSHLSPELKYMLTALIIKEELK